MEYYYGQEAEMFTFYRIPKLLFTDPRYKPLSTDAKLLYGLMLDRMGLSLKNHKQDARGRTYIFFRQEEAAELLGIGKNKTTKLYRELEKAGLIERKRQGLTHPDIIYVGRLTAVPAPSTAAEPAEPIPREGSFPQSEEFSTMPEPVSAAESLKTGFRNAEKWDSGTPENGILEADKSGFYLSNTYSSDTEKERDLSIYQGEAAQTPETASQPETSPPPFGIEVAKRIFKSNIDYAGLYTMQYPGVFYMPSTIDEILSLMVDEFTSSKPTIRAAGVDRPREDFRNRLVTMDADSVLRILYKLENRDPADRPIANRRAYLITMLYNHQSIDPTPYEDDTYL